MVTFAAQAVAFTAIWAVSLVALLIHGAARRA